MILDEHGRFWWHYEPVPEGHYAPENSVTGTIQIDDSGRTTLDLHGAIGNPPQASEGAGSNQISERASIQGRLTGTGRHALLTGLSRATMKFASYGMYEGYRAEYCLIGDAAIPSEMQDINIDRIAVELNGYDEWLDLESIDYSRTATGFSANYQKPDDIAYELDDGGLTVKYELYAPFGASHLRKMEAREVVSFVYSLTTPFSIRQAIQRYQLMQDFLILLTNSNRTLDLPTVGLASVEGEYTLHFQRNKSDDKGPGLFEGWIDFPKLKPVFGVLFAAWKAKREVFGPAFYLYLGTRRGQPQYIENRFLNLIVGLEAFHREKFSDHAAGSALRAKIDRILDNVQRPRDRKWLAGKLKAAAEPSLEERLFDLLADVPFGLERDALRRFARDSAKLRNDISHFGGWRKRGDYNDFIGEVHARNEIASGMYQALILQEIGLESAQLQWWFRQSPRAWPLRQYMQRFGLWLQ